MLKQILILLFISTLLLLSAVDLDNSSKVLTNYNFTFTGEHYTPEYSDLTSQAGYDFPLQSWNKLGRTVSNYLTSATKQQSLLLYQNNEAQVEGHVLGGVEFYSNNKRDSYLLPYYGFEVKAHYHNLSLAGKWWKGHTTSSDEYAHSNPLVNSWQKPNEDKIYLDKIQGEVKYSFNDFGYIALNRNKLNMGSNIGGSIILNDTKTNDYAYLNYHLKFGDFSVDFVHASLLSDSINTDKWLEGTIPKEDAPDKYLAIHRFNWKPSPKLYLFVGEQIYYGNRNIDYNYFLPVGFWRITEHNQADRDNVLIFAGGDYSITKTIDIYANVIFDELSKSKLFTNWWGNKYALQTGVMKSNLYKSPIFAWENIGAEVTAVRPWIYTHKYIYAKASNDDQPLGFADGSNLIKYTLENRLSFLNKRVDYLLNASYIKQGSEGNNYTFNYDYAIDDIEDGTANWFEGDVSHIYKLRNEINFNLLYSHRVKLSSEISKAEGTSPEVDFAISYQTRF